MCVKKDHQKTTLKAKRSMFTGAAPISDQQTGHYCPGGDDYNVDLDSNVSQILQNTGCPLHGPNYITCHAAFPFL